MPLHIPDAWQPTLAEEAQQPTARNGKHSWTRNGVATTFIRRRRVLQRADPHAAGASQSAVAGSGPVPRHRAGTRTVLLRPARRPAPAVTGQHLQGDEERRGSASANNGASGFGAQQGALMLNAVLTVRAHQANSHKGKGWETFTDAVIRRVSAGPEPVVFVLWGGYAQKKLALIDAGRHTVVQSAHPSPLSARNGFFGSRPFSQINAALEKAGTSPIDWQIPDIAPRPRWGAGERGRGVREPRGAWEWGVEPGPYRFSYDHALTTARRTAPRGRGQECQALSAPRRKFVRRRKRRAVQPLGSDTLPRLLIGQRHVVGAAGEFLYRAADLIGDAPQLLVHGRAGRRGDGLVGAAWASATTLTPLRRRRTARRRRSLCRRAAASASRARAGPG